MLMELIKEDILSLSLLRPAISCLSQTQFVVVLACVPAVLLRIRVRCHIPR